MGEDFSFDIDTTPAQYKLAEIFQLIREAKTETQDLAESTTKTVENSYNQVLAVARASYMMISGISRSMGGNMTQVFSAMYGAAIAGISAYRSIAAAIKASGPWGWVQAGVMTASLVMALTNVYAIMSEQTELRQGIRGINMSLHSIASLIHVFNRR